MTSASSDILTLIDTAVGCQLCGGELGGSPSSDFCTESCQISWHAARVEPSIGPKWAPTAEVRIDVGLVVHHWERLRHEVIRVTEGFRNLGAAFLPPAEPDAVMAGKYPISDRWVAVIESNRDGNHGPDPRRRPPRRLDARRIR